MKRLIKIVSLLLLFVGVSMGCSKFLDLDPPYTQDAENFFNNESEYLRALTGAYDLLAGLVILLPITLLLVEKAQLTPKDYIKLTI